MNTLTVAMFGLPGGTEWIIIGLIALLIFGRRLPDVARSLGKSIVEFKKGIKDVKDDIEDQNRLESTPKPKLERKPDTTTNSSASDNQET